MIDRISIRSLPLLCGSAWKRIQYRILPANSRQLPHGILEPCHGRVITKTICLHGKAAKALERRRTTSKTAGTSARAMDSFLDGQSKQPECAGERRKRRVGFLCVLKLRGSRRYWYCSEALFISGLPFLVVVLDHFSLHLYLRYLDYLLVVKEARITT